MMIELSRGLWLTLHVAVCPDDSIAPRAPQELRAAVVDEQANSQNYDLTSERLIEYQIDRETGRQTNDAAHVFTCLPFARNTLGDARSLGRSVVIAVTAAVAS